MVDAQQHQMPSFHRPPVDEMLLGVQFEPVDQLTSAHLGLFWDELGRDQWPLVNELDPIPQTIENLNRGSPADWEQIRFEMGPLPVPRIRLRLASEAKDIVLQVQRDRLQVHWVRQADKPYPRYPQVREQFIELWERWKQFLSGLGMNPLTPVQWEASYFNTIPAGEVWQTPSDWDSVIPGLLNVPPLLDLEPETAVGHFRYMLPNRCGRLYIAVQHVSATKTARERLRMTLTARGPLHMDRDATDPGTALPDVVSTHPGGATPDRVEGDLDHALLSGLDLGRSVIVRAFAAVTSENAHDYWNRQDGGKE